MKFCQILSWKKKTDAKGEKKGKKKAPEREVLTGYTSHRTDRQHPRVTDLEDVPKLASRSQHAEAGRELIN